LANETTAVNHKLNFTELTFNDWLLREERSFQRFAFSLLLLLLLLLFIIFFNEDLNLSSQEESSRIVSNENVHFSDGNYKTRSLKLANENAKS